MNLDISLPDELARFVRAKVETGRYASSSEVVREALRLLERHDREEAERLAALREAWRAGVDSGDAGELDLAALKEEARRRLAAKA